MKFRNRTEAGKLLAKKLKKYINKDVIVYALPRGGVVTGVEVAKYLTSPLDLLITRKITYPYNPEYAIAAISESGEVVGNRAELMTVDEKWLEEEMEKQKKEAVRRREEYLLGRKMYSPTGKTAIIVDDGVATGLSLRAGVLEIKKYHPKKIVIACPIIPLPSARIIQKEVDEIVAVEILPEDAFLGAVGAYYEDFRQVEGYEVIRILEDYARFMRSQDGQREFSMKHAPYESDFMDYDLP